MKNLSIQTKTKRKIFAELFTALCELFDKKLSVVLTDIYFKTLEKYTVEQIQAAFDLAFVACKFFPKPSDFIEFITGGQEKLDSEADIEAAKVLKAIKTYGAYNSVCFDNAITQAVITQHFGGWVKICQELTEETEKWFLKDFPKYYKSYSREGLKHFGKLCGIHEINNSANGLGYVHPVAYIGNVQKAKMIENKQDNVVQLSTKLKQITNEAKNGNCK